MGRNGKSSDFNFPVVGVGASAGGIAALTSLVKALPDDPAFAMAIVQHLHPDHESHLTRILSWHTPLRILEVTKDIALELGCIYIIAPRQVLTLERGVLRSRPAEDGVDHPHNSIDHFLESLAVERREKAIGVILSGTGSDGAAGAMLIKRAGGVVLVQEPASAMHDSMPLAAIATGAADYVLPPEAIARILPTTRKPALDRESAGEWKENSGLALAEIMAAIRDRTGFDLEGYRSTPLLASIHRGMQLRRIATLDDYAALLKHEPEEIDALQKLMLISVTSFFRNPDAWRALARDVIAGLFLGREADCPIRAWTSACATGEEAYSLAMILSEQRDAAASAADFQVFATDASQEMIKRASKGLFPADPVEKLSANRRDRFFDRAEGGYRVKKALRSKMVFAPQNLLADPPFSNLDLVTCRNLLIYLERGARERVLSLLNASLRPGGYLFLGDAESILDAEYGFEPVSEQFRIYRKIAGATRLAETLPKLRHGPLMPPTIRNRNPHEELEAAREELEALNEELNSVNAELSAINEELNEANAQLRGKVQELETQQNVLSSGGVITLFIDEDLRVRWFTPALCELFPLQPGDIGRRITDFAPRFIDADFPSAMRSVLATEKPHESEVQNTEGGWYQRRIRPYRIGKGRATGLAVTFADITALKNAENALRESQERQAFLLKLSDALRNLGDTAAIQETASRLLAEHLGVNLAMYSEFEGEGTARQAFIRGQYVREGAPFPSPVSYSDFIGGSVGGILRSGGVLVVADASREVRFGDAIRDAWLSAGIGAIVALGLVKNGRELAHFVVHSTAPRAWTQAEIELVREVADRTWAAVERARAEEALRQSEARYRMLFDSIDEGFCLCERMPGEQIDFRFIEANPAFERQSGLPWAGKTIRQIVPGIDETIMDTYRRVEATGRSEAFTAHVAQLGAWFEIEAFSADQPGRIAILFRNVSERKHAETALRESEARQKFLLKFSDAMRPLSDSEEIQLTAARMLGEYFGVANANYAQIETENGVQYYVVRHAYSAPGRRCVEGRYPFADFPGVTDELIRGQTMAVAEIASDARLTAEDKAAYAALDIATFLMAPLVKHGRLVANFAVHGPEPRAWTRAETEILEDVAERTWATVERARVETRLRQSEERLQRVLETDAVGVLFWDHEGVLIGANDAFLKMSGYSREEVERRSLGWRTMTPPEWVASSEEQLAICAKTGRIGPYEKEYFRKDGGRSWMLFTGRELGDGTVVEFVIDISDRKRAEKRQRPTPANIARGKGKEG